VPPAELHQDLRAGVRALCREYPDTYWRELDARWACPDGLVKALTDAGYLAALLPEEFGGSALGVTEASIILEEINRSGGNSGACHAQMFTMGIERTFRETTLEQVAPISTAMILAYPGEPVLGLPRSS
jgi:alkylation response protein AidB-like acyl-CoA dehydrogenase